MLVQDLPPAEPHLYDGMVLPLPFDLDGFSGSVRARLTQQFCSSPGILNNVSRKVLRQEFPPRAIPKHPHHRLIYFQKSSVPAAAANPIAAIPHQRAVAGLRTPQILFGAVALIAQHLL